MPLFERCNMMYRRILGVQATHEVLGVQYADVLVASGQSDYQATLMLAEVELCQVLERMPLSDAQRREIMAAAGKAAQALVAEATLEREGDD